MRTSFCRAVLVAMLSFTLGTLAILCGCSAAGGTGADAKTGGEEDSHPLIGAPAPDFAVDSVNGQGKISSKGLEGKVVVVDFWASWCEPCKKSFPKLQGLQVKYRASGLQVVGISEDEERTRRFLEFGPTYGATFPLGWDDGQKIAKMWQPKSMPASFVVDRKGIVRFAHLGYHDGDEEEIEKEVKSLL